MTDLPSGQCTRQFTTIFIDAYRIRGGDTPGSGAYVVAFEDRLAWGLGEADDLEAFFAHGLEHALTLLGEDHGPIRLRFFAWRSSFTRRIRHSAPMWIARGGLKANGEPVPHFAMWSKLHGMLEAGDLKLAYGGRREAGALGKAATAKLEDCLARVRALGLHTEDGIVERGQEAAMPAPSRYFPHL